MIIYIFRHAQKAMEFNSDPDLTPEGHGQASQLLKKVLNKELPQPTQLWASPKKRAQSTLRPLARHFHLNLQSVDNLLEQSSTENIAQFRQRIQETLQKISQLENEVIFLCSHYDWVSEAMALAPCDKDLSEADFYNWTPAQHVGFKINQGIFEYLELKRISL